VTSKFMEERANCC